MYETKKEQPTGKQPEKKAVSPQAATVSEDALSFQNDPLFNHPLLRGYWPSERRAILYYRIRLVERLEVKELDEESPAEIVVEQLLVRREKGPGGAWRHDKMRRDGEEQMHEPGAVDRESAVEDLADRERAK